jgi:hypothetical protein
MAAAKRSAVESGGVSTLSGSVVESAEETDVEAASEEGWQPTSRVTVSARPTAKRARWVRVWVVVKWSRTYL